VSSPNRDSLVRVARALGPLLPELTFVGGQVAELLVTDPAATRVRPTDDVDVVTLAAGRVAYHALGERLRTLGFREDTTPGAPLCRWCLGDDRLDVMPADGDVLGFRNRWYDIGALTAVRYEIAKGLSIRIVTAPVFVATKWEAFHERGAGEWYGSHDIEDIVTVVAGRPALLEELRRADQALRACVVDQTRDFLGSGVADDVILGALPDARLLPGTTGTVRGRFEAIAGLAI
jgi:hypothetical protein